MTVPSSIRISENDAARPGPGLRLRASVSICPDQFELRSALKMTAMVGRISETSAISMRPVRKGKNRRRATTRSAVKPADCTEGYRNGSPATPTAEALQLLCDAFVAGPGWNAAAPADIFAQFMRAMRDLRQNRLSTGIRSVPSP